MMFKEIMAELVILVLIANNSSENVMFSKFNTTITNSTVHKTFHSCFKFCLSCEAVVAAHFPVENWHFFSCLLKQL